MVNLTIFGPCPRIPGHPDRETFGPIWMSQIKMFCVLIMAQVSMQHSETIFQNLSRNLDLCRNSPVPFAQWRHLNTQSLVAGSENQSNPGRNRNLMLTQCYLLRWAIYCSALNITISHYQSLSLSEVLHVGSGIATGFLQQRRFHPEAVWTQPIHTGYTGNLDQVDTLGNKNQLTFQVSSAKLQNPEIWTSDETSPHSHL